VVLRCKFSLYYWGTHGPWSFSLISLMDNPALPMYSLDEMRRLCTAYGSSVSGHNQCQIYRVIHKFALHYINHTSRSQYTICANIAQTINFWRYGTTYFRLFVSKSRMLSKPQRHLIIDAVFIDQILKYPRVEDEVKIRINWIFVKNDKCEEDLQKRISSKDYMTKSVSC